MSDTNNNNNNNGVAVDMERVYDDVLRLADEYNHKLSSFSALLSGGFISWVLLILLAATTGHSNVFHAALTAPFALLFLSVYAYQRGDLVWRTPTGENIVQHCTATAFYAAVSSHRALLITTLVNKQEGLWPHIVDVANRATTCKATPGGRLIFALNKLVAESVRQRALYSI